MKKGYHATIGIMCPKYGHANFKTGGGKFICNSCGKDFTDEVREIFSMLYDIFSEPKQFKKVKSLE